MSDHLPECPLASDCKHDYYDEPPIQCANCGEECFCDRLRACEQRVRLENDDYAYVAAQAEADGRRRGWNEALDAAREAVAGVLHWSEGELGLICNWNSACDAIDALRGEHGATAN